MLNSVIIQTGGCLGYLIERIRLALLGVGGDVFLQYMTSDQVSNIDQTLQRYKSGDYCQDTIDILYFVLADVLGIVISVIDSVFGKVYNFKPLSKRRDSDAKLKVLYVHRPSQQHYTALVPTGNSLKPLHEVLKGKSSKEIDTSFLCDWEGNLEPEHRAVDSESELSDVLNLGTLEEQIEAQPVNIRASGDIVEDRCSHDEEEEHIGAHEDILASGEREVSPRDESIIDRSFQKWLTSNEEPVADKQFSDENESSPQMNEPSELNAGFQQWLTRYEEPVPDRIPLPYSSLFSGLKRARCEDWVISMPEPRPITQSEPSDQQCTDSPMSETMHEEPDRQSEKRLRLCLERIDNLQTEDIMHREDPDATTSAQSGSTIPIMDIDDLLVQAQSCVTHNPQQEDKSDRNIIAYYPTNGSETSGEDSPVAKSRHRSMSVFPNSSSSEEGSVSSDDPAETAKGDHTGSSSHGRSSEGSECGDEFQSKQTSFNEESSSQVSDDFSSQDISSQMLARTPLFSTEHITSKYKIFDVLLKADDVDPSKICQKVPFRPEKQLCFLIDTSSEHIKHRDDIRSDGNGTYTHTGVHKDYFSQSAKKVSDCSEAKYLLKASYFTHRTTKVFCRRIFELYEKQDSKFVPRKYVFLAYYFKNGQECCIARPPHGNGSSRRSFERAKKSTLMAVRSNQQQGRSAAETYNTMLAEAGGIMSCDNTTELPRGMQQIYDIRRSSSEEMIVNLINRSRMPDSEVIFVSEVPYLVIVLAKDWQLDLMEMCMTDQHKSIIGIDVTYNCTQFYVTPLCLSHPLLVNQNGKRPYMIGPTCITNSQSSEVFTIFANALILKRKTLRDGALVLGSDYQKGLVDGFSEPFRNVQHIACFRHLERNISTKLETCTSGVKRDILSDILYGETSLANSSAEEFRAQLVELESKWEKLFPGLHQWFVRYQADRFIKSVIRDARDAAGLEDGEVYYNNSCESINSLIKKDMNARTTVPDFIDRFSERVQKTLTNMERSLVCEGPYSLKVKYKKQLEINKSSWATMNLNQRLKARDKLLKGKVTNKEKPAPTPSRSKVIVTSKKKSKKPGEKIRLRSRTGCSSSAHKSTKYYFLKKSKLIKKGMKCYSCRKVIAADSQGMNAIIAVGTVHMTSEQQEQGMKEYMLTYVHLMCLRGSILHGRTLHMCPEFENSITEEQNDLLI